MPGNSGSRVRWYQGPPAVSPMVPGATRRWSCLSPSLLIPRPELTPGSRAAAARYVDFATPCVSELETHILCTLPAPGHRCIEPEKDCDETSARPLQYFRIKVSSDDLNSGGDPRRAHFDLVFHGDPPSACAAQGLPGASMQPRPSSVDSTASSSGVWGSRPRTAVKRALSIRTASRQR